MHASRRLDAPKPSAYVCVRARVWVDTGENPAKYMQRPISRELSREGGQRLSALFRYHAFIQHEYCARGSGRGMSARVIKMSEKELCRMMRAFQRLLSGRCEHCVFKFYEQRSSGIAGYNLLLVKISSF